MSVPISVVCADYLHLRCGLHLLNHTTCTCWCHALGDLSRYPQCEECWGLGEMLTGSQTWEACTVCHGLGHIVTDDR